MANDEQKYLTVGQVIEQLQKLPPDQVLVINIKQFNKVYGKQVKIMDSPAYGDRQVWIDGSYGGACITVHLPGNAGIVKWPENF